MRTKSNATGVKSGRPIAISVGDDIIAVQAIAASLEAEGIDVDVILSSDPYVGVQHTSPHRLMIHEDDADAARPIIATYLPELATRAAESGEPSVVTPAKAVRPKSSVGRRRNLFGALLLAVFALSPFIVMARVLADVLGSF